MEKVNMEAIKNAHLRIALDPMYGVSETALSTILISGRCDLTVIHREHDTLFGGRDACSLGGYPGPFEKLCVGPPSGSGHCYRRRRGPAGVIDDTGRYLHPNDILLLLYYYLLRYRKWDGPVVRNIATTHRSGPAGRCLRTDLL